jgi:hypothetical protein
MVSRTERADRIQDVNVGLSPDQNQSDGLSIGLYRPMKRPSLVAL